MPLMDRIVHLGVRFSSWELFASTPRWGEFQRRVFIVHLQALWLPECRLSHPTSRGNRVMRACSNSNSFAFSNHLKFLDFWLPSMSWRIGISYLNSMDSYRCNWIPFGCREVHAVNFKTWNRVDTWVSPGYQNGSADGLVRTIEIHCPLKGSWALFTFDDRSSIYSNKTVSFKNVLWVFSYLKLEIVNDTVNHLADSGCYLALVKFSQI